MSIMIAPIESHEKAMLKLAQFKEFITNKKLINRNIEVILQGVDLNAKVSSTIFLGEHDSQLIGDTLLHIAYNYGNIRVFNVLIRKGANVGAKNKRGNTVLHEIFQHLCGFYPLIQWDIKKEESYSIAKRTPFIASTLSAHVDYKNTDNPSDSNGLTHFHVACATNSFETVGFFLRSGVPVNQSVDKAVSDQYFEGYTALHFAAQFGCLKTIEILLKHGANVNLKDAKGRIPLIISLERNIAMIDSSRKMDLISDIQTNEKIIYLLLDHNNIGFTELCAMSTMQNFCLNVNNLCQTNNVNQRISQDSQIWPGYTAVHLAAHVNVDTLKQLIKYGGDVEVKDANGVTPFDMCINRYKAEDIVDILSLVPKWESILLSDGETKLIDLLSAFKNTDGISSFLQKSNDNIKLFVPFDSPLWPGFSVLHVAVLLSERKNCKSDYKKKEKHMYFEPDLNIVTEILKQGADVTVKDHRNWTPIHFAFRHEKTQTLNLLLKYHHKTKNFTDDQNLSHLHIACAVKNQDLVEKLLWNEVDVHVVYEGDSSVSQVYPGWTPLHVSVYKRDFEIAKLLLKFGANVYAIDRHGVTPIHVLRAYPKHASKMLFGVSNLHDVEVEVLGLSYLHVACFSLNVNAVERLLGLGVDVNKVITCKTEDNKNFPNTFNLMAYDGWTPLHCALNNSSLASACRLKLFNLLVERGADMLVKDSKGVSPLHMILEKGTHELLNVLVAALKGSEDLRKRMEMEIGVTMFHVACRKVDVDLMKESLDAGVDVNARISEHSKIWPGYTPLHVLLVGYDGFVGDDIDRLEEFDEIVKLLLDRGADVTLSNAEKRTALHVAYHRLYAELDDSYLPQVSMMLKTHKNFEVNPTSIEGISHFHIACHVLDVDVVENFLDQGDVDVNSRIDVFAHCTNAANTPLLLASKTKTWGQDYVKREWTELFAELKVVDLLMKRGARVNVEDIDGNTPAHYAAISGRLNLMQRLASEANVNAMNLRGQKPLELLVRNKDTTLEEIRYFIACGCRFNAFNAITDEGYIALADSVLNHEDMLGLLFGTFVNFPGLMRRDYMSRTAIHNIVSVNGSKTHQAQYVEYFDMLMKFGCDIDDRDDLGRTALLLAAQFRNESAAAGLLLAGADVNITDHSGKTPFAYVRESCFRCNVPDKGYHDQFEHFELFKMFVTQMQKLQLCSLELHPSNDDLLSETFTKLNPEELVGRSEIFLPQLERMGALKVEPYSLVVMDFVSDTGAVIDYPLMSRDKRRAIDGFFQTNKSRFREEFKEAAGIIQLQYRQALLREKIINVAKDSLSVLMQFRLPDLCSHIVLRLLKNFELQNLILSASRRETRV